MKLTIGKKIVCGFAALTAVTIGLGFFSYSRTRAIDKEMQTLVNAVNTESI